MKIRILSLLPLLAVLLHTRAFAQSAQPVHNAHLITNDLGENHWDQPPLIFASGYIVSGLDADDGPYYLIPEAEIDSVNTDYVTLNGTNISESSGSPITGSSDLTFTGYTDDTNIETSSNPYFTDGFNASDLYSTGTFTASYEYYYSVDGSGEIYLNYDLQWSGHITGYLPPDGSYEDEDDSLDSGYLAVDTYINVSSLPVNGGGGSQPD
jgi:hypothetical protein